MAMPSLFIPHGAGPCFFMRWTMGPEDMWLPLGHWLRTLSLSLPERPSAILVVSAHWETDRFTLASASSPGLVYDYHGFPAHTYQLTYPAPGAPWLAERACALLGEAGLQASLNERRGLDHGAFVPLKLIYPDADIPILQMSLREDLDPATHLAAGAALASLREEKVLIVGSGMSFHNLRPTGADVEHRAQVFDDWLAETMACDPVERHRRLSHWQRAPEARFAHPREEHLLPLLVACGAAADQPARRVYAQRLAGQIAVSAFRFG